MNEENVTEEKPQVNFYKLNLSKPYSVVSGNKYAVRSCTLNDGVITSVSKRCIASGGREDEYEVEIVYKFTDDKMRERCGSVKSTSNIDAQFFKGQYIMVAFDDAQSFIMEKFTLTDEDKAKLLAVEAERSSDDFDDLSNELEDVDMSKPIKSLEYNFLYKAVAIILAVIVGVYFIPVGIFFLPNMFDGTGSIVPTLITSFMIFLIPFLLVCFIIILSYKYCKRQRRVNKILKDKPYFVYGKVFYTERTYNKGSRKKLLYCYIDKWNEKHTEVLSGVFANAAVSPRSALIAYTADGRSVPIGEFTYLNHEDYENFEEDEEIEEDGYETEEE